MKILKSGALVAGMLLSLGAQAEILTIQEAIEASSLRVFGGNSGNGHVVASACSKCTSMRLEMTPATIVSIDGKPVPAGKKISGSWTGGVVIYDVETKKVVKLKL